jgi:hypothetical protein
LAEAASHAWSSLLSISDNKSLALMSTSDIKLPAWQQPDRNSSKARSISSS